MCTSQHYLSFAIVKVEEVIIKPLYYMLKIFGQHRFYVVDGTTAKVQEGIIHTQLDFAMLYHEGTSLMQITNNKGPIRDPCGTPNEMDRGLDVDPLTTTLCVLSDKLSGGWGSEKPKTKIRARENVPAKIYAK